MIGKKVYTKTKQVENNNEMVESSENQNYYKAKNNNNYETPVVNTYNYNTNEAYEFTKKKKVADCTFISISDITTRKKIEKYAKPPAGGTNFTFWVRKEEPYVMGLTIKCIPLDNNGKPQSTHQWKVTWIDNGTSLAATDYCKTIIDDIEDENYNEIKSIFFNQKGGINRK